MRKTKQTSIIPNDPVLHIRIRSDFPGSRRAVEELEKQGYKVIAATCKPHRKLGRKEGRSWHSQVQ